MVTDSHHFDQEQDLDPYQSEQSDPQQCVRVQLHGDFWG
jgi:hypothetical protein